MTRSDDPQAKLRNQLSQTGYIADPALVSSLHLMNVLEKPLLIEGEAGVGKTEVAKSLATIHKAPLLRLQCYEGLDAQHALYDWDYKRQLLAIQMAGKSTTESDSNELKNAVYSDEYLLQRPLLAAIRSPERSVLLIDEVDRADEEFEALLLEVLSDFQISVPELGTYTAIHRPLVVLTSNGVRELSDALRRRCLYHYVDYPSAAAELNIVRARLPEMSQQLAHQVVNYVQTLRQAQLRKTPGVAETLDWAAAMIGIGVKDLSASPEAIENTLTCLLKTREDREYVLRAKNAGDPDGISDDSGTKVDV